ncbi:MULTISPECIES: hypothetical protein [unclassified Muribaculum]|jgi:hypothetical protein|nr:MULTISPECIES: hypothetical protein [unclassified Muribaculum]
MAKLSDKYILIQCELRPTFDFQQEILSHGDEVEVLAPEHYDNVLSKVAGVKSALCPVEHFDSIWRGARCKDCGRRRYCPDPIA